MYRVSSSLATTRYLSDLRQVQLDIAKLLRQTSTGKAYERPSDAPARAAVGLDLHSSLSYLHQYTRNVDDGSSRLEYTETTIYEADSMLQRARELTVQSANTYLTRSDRSAIAEEMNQLLEHVVGLSNANFRGRYIFSGYETLTESFDKNINTGDGMLNSVTYRGDYGEIGRNIGIQRDLGVNFTGKSVFTENTYTITGRQMSDDALGYNGTFQINDKLIVVTPTMDLVELRDLINADPEIEVNATIDDDYRLVLESLNSTQPIELEDISGTVLRDMELLPMGAFNLARVAPLAGPMVDSTGALHSNNLPGPAPGYPITLTPANQDMVVTLTGAANDGFTQTEVLKLDAITYNSAAELAAEIQRKADNAFGADTLIVTNPAGDEIQIETFVQSSQVLASDFQIGGTSPGGITDTASGILGFNATPATPLNADAAGTDGNDRFTIDLGLSAYRVKASEEPVDLPAIEINIEASQVLTAGVNDVTKIVANINKQLLDNDYLSGLVEAREDGGRVRIETTKKGAEILETDLVLANAVTGAVADPPGTDPWDTLGILGFYRDPATGISEPQQPAQVQGTVDHAGGIVIVAGVNDSFNIDLGPSASIDGTNPASVTVTLAPGAYADASALAAEINTQINNDATLKNAVLAEVRTVGPQEFVDIVTVNEGSRVQASDLLLTDDTPGTLAALGLAGATIPGGGTSAGQGQIDQPDNIINTMIQIRDELYGYAARSSRLTDLLDDNEQGLGVFPGAEIVIHSDGTSSSFVVQRFTTMDDFADRIEEKLGFQLEVDVLRDGKIQIFNPTTTVINDVKIEAFDRQGNHITPFEDKMAGLSGKLVYRSEVRSDTVYEDERFQEMTQRIGDMDNGMETVLSVLSIIGARQQRLTMTKDQNDRIEVNIAELQSENDTVDMAETIMRLQEQESVLRATLGVGAQVIPPSLFDFLR